MLSYYPLTASKISRKLYDLPYSLLFLIFSICVCSIAVLYSAGGGNMHPWAFKQAMFCILFFPIMIIIAVTDIKVIYNLTYLCFIGAVISLILVAIAGHTAMGAKRWIKIASFSFQPSELAKIASILMLARYFHDAQSEDIGRIKIVMVPVLLMLVPIGLIIKQPDLGTGMILLFTTAALLFAAGARIWKFISVGLGALVAMPFLWGMLHAYQKKRVYIFLNPESDPLGSGYNIIQSKIAIGSGGIFGKGYTKGTQSQLRFLPEHQTDFIFPTFAEETGFIGGIILLLLYAAIIILSSLIAVQAKSVFAKLTATGIGALFFCHIFINMAMVMGMLPVVGIPLPLVSYGGTMVGSMFIAFGILMNIYIHRNTIISR